jgi:hypothetical protein
MIANWTKTDIGININLAQGSISKTDSVLNHMLLCTIDQLYMETILRQPRARKEKGEVVVKGEKSDMNNYW